MEIIVVLVIMGIAAAFIIPNLISSMEQTKAQAAKNNLLAISAAQQKYFEDTNNVSYCLTGCGDTTANINNNLHLSIASNDPFTYSCSSAAVPYQCTASDGTDTLTLSISSVGAAVSCSGSYCPS